MTNSPIQSTQVAAVAAPVPPEAPDATPSITPARAITNREAEVEGDPTPGPRGKKAAKGDTSPRAASLLKVAAVCKSKVAKPSEKPVSKKRPQSRPGQ